MDTGKRIVLLAAALALASCGGEAPAPAGQAGFSAQRHAVLAPSRHTDLVQQLYLAFFGRPADPAGLAYHQAALERIGAPPDMPAFALAYHGDAGIRALVDGMSGSAEARALHGDDPAILIAALYRHGFNRDAEPEGLAFWLRAIRLQALNPSAAVLSIVAGARDGDLDTWRRKTDMALAFTEAADPPARRLLYSGAGPNSLVRELLGGVHGATSAQDIARGVEDGIAALAAGEAHVLEDGWAEVPAGARSVVLLYASGLPDTLRERLDALAPLLAADLNGRSGRHGPAWKVVVRQAALTPPAVREQLQGMTAALLVGEVPVPTRVDSLTRETVPNLDPYRVPSCLRYRFPQGSEAVEDPPGSDHVWTLSEDPACRNGMTVAVLRASVPARETAELASKLDQMIGYHRDSDRANAAWAPDYRHVNALWSRLNDAPPGPTFWEGIHLYAPSRIAYLDHGTGSERLEAFKRCLGDRIEMCTFNGHGSSSVVVAEGPDPVSDFYSSDAVSLFASELRSLPVGAKFVNLESCSTQNFLSAESFGTTLLLTGDTLLVMGATTTVWSTNYIDKYYAQAVYQALSYGGTFADAFAGKFTGSAMGMQGDPFISLRPRATGAQPKAVIDGRHYNVHPAIVPLAFGDVVGAGHVTRTILVTNPGMAELRIRLSAMPEHMGSTGRVPDTVTYSRDHSFSLVSPRASIAGMVGNVGDLVHAVAPGASLAITLSFKAEMDFIRNRLNAGLHSGAYEIYTNDPQSPRIIFELRGNAR